jgi:ribonuclease P protein component
VEARWRNEGGDKSRSGPIGIGFTASRKAGNSVVRNRARRRLKEAARKLLPELGLAGADYVIVARAGTAETTWAALLDDLGNALLRLRADLEAGVAQPHMPREHRPERYKKPNAAKSKAASESE